MERHLYCLTSQKAAKDWMTMATSISHFWSTKITCLVTKKLMLAFHVTNIWQPVANDQKLQIIMWFFDRCSMYAVHLFDIVHTVVRSFLPTRCFTHPLLKIYITSPSFMYKIKQLALFQDERFQTNIWHLCCCLFFCTPIYHRQMVSWLGWFDLRFVLYIQ